MVARASETPPTKTSVAATAIERRIEENVAIGAQYIIALRRRSSLSLCAPVNKQAGNHQKKRAASHLGFVNPNIGSARRRNQGNDHGKERDGEATEPDDKRPFRAARNEQAFAARLLASPTVSHKAEEEVKVGNEVDEERHIQQDKERSLDRCPFAQHR